MGRCCLVCQLYCTLVALYAYLSSLPNNVCHKHQQSVPLDHSVRTNLQNGMRKSKGVENPLMTIMYLRNTQWRNAISTPPPPLFFGRKNPGAFQNDTWLDIRVGVLTCVLALSTFAPSHGNFSFPGNTDPRRSLRRVSLKVEIFRLWGRGCHRLTKLEAPP